MKFIRDIHRTCQQEGRPAISFEFFPPKTDEGERNLFEKTLPALMAASPDYCSVTYGAGGTTREKTIGIVDRIQREHGLTTMMHLTCVNSTADELRAVVEDARSRGICNLLALRGDPPDGGEFQATPGGFEYSRDLVAFLRAQGGFSIGTAGFPEGHIACKAGKIADWGYLREKIEAGADFVITQLFFDNEDFYQFHDFMTKKLGAAVPIIPGLLPVLSSGQTRRFTALCGAALPAKFLNRLEELGEDDAAVTEFGIEYATQQSEALLRFGVAGLHFYTLNKPYSTVRIVKNLGLVP
ncbi:MAG TPA: methylenetetrahydrofolate reductase [NAD(P)H] [Chthoniobacteraceae bacterium]|jgi:methylenetetrahydrofolate reductase (NADPH)|nr:Methylenetetrahydrofolate reductase [Chthoniobacter sp.]HEV7867523.1 methylenetetrahydrofolate reductase [NAD(P)H] [Chthoniobacteraceae bacterium]